MILAKKINNELSVYVKRTKIESRHEAVFLEITFGEDATLKCTQKTSAMLKNITYHVRYEFQSESTPLWFASMSRDTLPKEGVIYELSVRLRLVRLCFFLVLALQCLQLTLVSFITLAINVLLVNFFIVNVK